MNALERSGFAATAVAVLVSACGGSEDPWRADLGQVRYYEARFRQNQSISLISFAGGLVYGFYQDDFSQAQVPDFAYAGYFAASPAALLPSDSTRIGHDYRFNTRETVPISLSGFAATDQALAVDLETDQGSERLYAARAAVDELATDTALLSGAYSLQARSTVDSLKGTASMGQAGDLLAELPGGCQVTGTVVPRPRGNLYDTSVTFGSSCTLAKGVLSGHAFQSYASRNTYLMLRSASGSGVLLLLVPEGTQ